MTPRYCFTTILSKYILLEQNPFSYTTLVQQGRSNVERKKKIFKVNYCTASAGCCDVKVKTSFTASFHSLLVSPLNLKTFVANINVVSCILHGLPIKFNWLLFYCNLYTLLCVSFMHITSLINAFWKSIHLFLESGIFTL